jgi:hypothetical protein
VFEENTIVFIKRHRIVIGDPIPLGYRATWENRDSLVVAKLGGKLTPKTTTADFQSILISSTSTDADIIEVHIFGPIHRKAVERLSGPQPRKNADKAILASVKRKLKEIGATWEART